MNIRDIAYEIATGNFLTQGLTEHELGEINSSDIPLERFEDWPEEMLNHAIHSLAEEIIERFI